MHTLILLLLLLLALPSQASELRIAVASNFRPALEQLAPLFTQQHQVVVKLSSGASGQLVAQIQQGAPFDLFLSADSHYPQHLYRQGLTEKPITYARGRLLLIGDKPAASEQALLARATRIGFANPELAPYGAAAKQVLQILHRWPAAKTQIYAQATNISQVQQWYETGQLDAAFVAASLARDQYPAQFDLTKTFNLALEQQAVLLKRSHQPAVANQFLAFLQQPQVQHLLVNLGYQAVARGNP
ncbi:molybdate ABC transporter substrate-binding protein [Simiduia litorea]|uniref:molybdate ABC transporter substrate-binding protein n=1 Tax=Simiduia litorea TaxID=1435348 RepID=UPI0036F2E795